MKIGLFIPCYIDAFFPEVGIATLELLERLGQKVIYPRDQTCCGQPRFPHRVGLRNSCGTLRRLEHAKPSELREPFYSKPMDLLSKIEGASSS